MSGNMVELIRQARSGPAASETIASPEVDADAVDEHPSYGKLRGRGQAAYMLELRLANGDGEAFDYGLLARVRFDPSAGVTLMFAPGKVTIRGKNLRPLYEALLAHRVVWVAEVGEPTAAARDPDVTVVTGIAIEAAGR